MRRVHVANVHTGVLTLDPAEAHHLRAVLRVSTGETVEAFDAGGRSGVARVLTTEPELTLEVDAVTHANPNYSITVAAAVPKGDRADWMVEKLSEIGVTRYVPLRTARSVVHPEGKSKTERWQRIAVESAKQCRRPGVLTIDALTDLQTLLPTLDPKSAVVLSTRPDARPLRFALEHRASVVLLIGPEGDWSEGEETAFAARGLTAASLGRTILRVETAAVLAAGAAMLLTPTTLG